MVRLRLLLMTDTKKRWMEVEHAIALDSDVFKQLKTIWDRHCPIDLPIGSD